jgi:hypothetical protein
MLVLKWSERARQRGPNRPPTCNKTRKRKAKQTRFQKSVKKIQKGVRINVKKLRSIAACQQLVRSLGVAAVRLLRQVPMRHCSPWTGPSTVVDENLQQNWPQRRLGGHALRPDPDPSQTNPNEKKKKTIDNKAKSTKSRKHIKETTKIKTTILTSIQNRERTIHTNGFH